MTAKLKPCPFCGKSVAIFTDMKELEECYNYDQGICDDLDYVCSRYPIVVCDATKGGCGASAGYGESKKEAIEKWNRRAKTRHWPLRPRWLGDVWREINETI